MDPSPAPNAPALLPGQVRALLLDVDGVLTDGHLLLAEDGTESRRFHVHDGQGLALLRGSGVEVAVVSARRGGAAEARRRELGIAHMAFACADKYRSACALLETLGCAWAQTVCVGDDAADVPLLRAAALGVAVADARAQAIAAADWVTPSPGGRGAVRDVCGWILGA